jgi:DNA-binding transcriptional regulator YdaS (Cro superfamily)
VKAVAQEYQEQLLFFHVDAVGDNAAVYNLLAVSEAWPLQHWVNIVKKYR